MAESQYSYLDFAESDYMYFKGTYDDGYRGSPMAAMGQNICEKYLKHIIAEYSVPETRHEEEEKNNILRTHNLQKLVEYIRSTMEIEIPEELELRLDVINGYYFTTRYPGHESSIPTPREIEKAYRAVESTREFTLTICREFDIEHSPVEELDDYSIDEDFEL